jgi:hypothetical protein
MISPKVFERLAVLAALAVISGCFNPALNDGQFACGDGQSCPADFMCVRGECRRANDVPDANAVEVDATSTDAEVGLLDAKAVDAKPSNTDASSFAGRWININGPSYTGVDYPGDWESDNGSGDTCSGSNYDAGAVEIYGTVDDLLFGHAVFQGSGNDINCFVGNIPDGTYTLTLLLGEVWIGPTCPGGGGVGSRVFNVYSEGNLLESDVDIYAAGGCIVSETTAQPIIKQYTVAVSGGGLGLFLEHVSGSGPLINAISIQ